jgi:hypothetical protein
VRPWTRSASSSTDARRSGDRTLERRIARRDSREQRSHQAECQQRPAVGHHARQERRSAFRGVAGRRRVPTMLGSRGRRRRRARARIVTPRVSQELRSEGTNGWTRL